MKKSFITAFVLTAMGLASTANAAQLYSSNLGNGITNASGAAVSTGTVRYGYFPSAFDFAANANNFAALDAAFVQVSSFSGNIRTQNTDGFFDLTQTFATNVAFETVPYDSSAGSTSNVGGDVAGEKIYIWILNNATPASATEQAIFSINQTWPDSNELFTDVTASIDSGTSGLTAHLGALAAGANIGAGAPSHSMANPLGSALATRTLPATGGNSVLRNTVVTFSVSVSGTGPFTYKWRKNTVEIGGLGTTTGSAATANTYSIGTAELDEDGSYDCVVTNALGSVTSNALVLDVFTVAPVVTLDAISQILNVGDPLTLAIDAEGQATLKYQWSLNGKPILNAINRTYSIPSAALANGGQYICTVSNGTTAKDTSTAEVVVVDNTPKTLALKAGATATTTLKVNVGGTPLSYEWFKDNMTLGVTTPSLIIKPLTAAVVGSVYKCVVTGAAGPKDGATTTLNIFDKAPTFNFTTPGVPAMPDGIVSGSYSYQIRVSGDADKAPSGYDAIGLPVGLSINKLTGLISGKPTLAKLNSKITLKIINSVGTTSIDDFIDIAGFPAGIAGTYVGPVERIAKLGADIGGRLDNLIVSPTGVISGKLILGVASYPLVGAVDVSGLNPLTATASASVVIKRTGNLQPLSLSFDLGADLISNGDLTDNTDHVYLEGWRNKWAAAPVGSNATNYAGLYNIGIVIPDETAPSTPNPDKSNLNYPQGASYASFTVGKDGKFTFTGKLADGEGITGGTFVGPSGQIFMFQTLYTTVLKGSLLGKLVINDNATTAVTDNVITGDADWSRPENKLPSNRLYRNGFAPINLTIVGGQFTPPALLLGLTSGTDNAALSFEQGGIDAADRVPNVNVSVQTGNKVTVSAPNPALVKLTAVATTGLFSGSFVLKDENPVTAIVNADELTRTPAFQGLIVPVEGSLIGVGYFLLDQIPSAGPPATTATTSPRLSGGAYFEAK
jgi:hypothetical protein